MSPPPPSPLKLRARLFCGEEIAMGPGKADLLDAIGRLGSISGAGRALGMSYRRTWDLVDAMNRCWASPLVETSAGGSRGGGARLTAFGMTILADFRAVEARIAEAAEGEALDRLEAALLHEPKRSQRD